MKILLIGKRAKILEQAAEQLRLFGCDVELTNNLDMGHLKSLNVSGVSSVVYGRALTREQKNTLTTHYRQQNPSLTIVEGWAPIPELITYQIVASTRPIPGLTVSGTKITATQNMKLHIKMYRLNWLYRVKTNEITIDIKADTPTDIAAISRDFAFLVIENKHRYCVLRSS